MDNQVDGLGNSGMAEAIVRALKLLQQLSTSELIFLSSKARELASSRASSKPSSEASSQAELNNVVSSRSSSTSNGNCSTEALEVLQFLNEKSGKNFRANLVNLQFIEARLRSGATVENCRGVIVRQCRDWLADPSMRKYLRPATLFNATKFEQYLGEKTSVN